MCHRPIYRHIYAACRVRGIIGSSITSRPASIQECKEVKGARADGINMEAGECSKVQAQGMEMGEAWEEYVLEGMTCDRCRRMKGEDHDESATMSLRGRGFRRVAMIMGGPTKELEWRAVFDDGF